MTCSFFRLFCLHGLPSSRLTSRLHVFASCFFSSLLIYPSHSRMHLPTLRARKVPPPLYQYAHLRCDTLVNLFNFFPHTLCSISSQLLIVLPSLSFYHYPFSTFSSIQFFFFSSPLPLLNLRLVFSSSNLPTLFYIVRVIFRIRISSFSPTQKRREKKIFCNPHLTVVVLLVVFLFSPAIVSSL